MSFCQIDKGRWFCSFCILWKLWIVALVVEMGKNPKLGVGSKVFLQRSGAIVKVATTIQVFCIIPHPTIYLMPKFEANWPKNDRVIEWAPFLEGARQKWRRGATQGAVALQCRHYIIPHPTIYLLPEFEVNWPKNDRVIEWAPFCRVARPEMAPRRHIRHRRAVSYTHLTLPTNREV